jgi:acetyl esterase/lipase
VVPGAHGVPLRVHRPRGAVGARPCLLWLHGGGFVMGDCRMDDPELARWAEELGCVAVSVGYRLAPEHPYPAALDDAYAALRWVAANAGRLGVDPARIGVGGGSAGAGLAAALALLARDRGGPPLAFQYLDAPALDDRMATPSSGWEDASIWPAAANRFAWRAYLGARSGDVPAYAAPARADDLAGLPPAFVSVGGSDGFVDEDVAYAARLMRAGVPTELHVYPGAPHGFRLAAGTRLAERAGRDADAWLRGVLAD